MVKEYSASIANIGTAVLCSYFFPDAFEVRDNLQGDQAACSKPPVDIDGKVTFYNQDLIQGDQSACAKPPVDFKTTISALAWPGQGRPGQSGTFF